MGGYLGTTDTSQVSVLQFSVNRAFFCSSGFDMKYQHQLTFDTPSPPPTRIVWLFGIATNYDLHLMCDDKNQNKHYPITIRLSR